MADNHFASVGVIVFRDKKVLLVRHTYGSAKGKLLNPGGYLQEGELPEDAVKREVMEETGVTVEPAGMLTLRCSVNGWYMVFIADYVSGEPRPDGHENDEAVFMDFEEVLSRDDTTDTVKTLIRLAMERNPITGVDTGKNRFIYTANEKK